MSLDIHTVRDLPDQRPTDAGDISLPPFDHLLFVGFTCPNRPHENSDVRCNHFIAGPSLETLKSYSFDKPFHDTRYCVSCNAVIEIKINSLESTPQYKVVDKPYELKYVNHDEVFIGNCTEGRKIRKRGAKCQAQ